MGGSPSVRAAHLLVLRQRRRREPRLVLRQHAAPQRHHRLKVQLELLAGLHERVDFCQVRGEEAVDLWRAGDVRRQRGPVLPSLRLERRVWKPGQHQVRDAHLVSLGATPVVRVGLGHHGDLLGRLGRGGRGLLARGHSEFASLSAECHEVPRRIPKLRFHYLLCRMPARSQRHLRKGLTD